jgi:hypothetical protein
LKVVIIDGFGSYLPSTTVACVDLGRLSVHFMSHLRSFDHFLADEVKVLNGTDNILLSFNQSAFGTIIHTFHLWWTVVIGSFSEPPKVVLSL